MISFHHPAAFGFYSGLALVLAVFAWSRAVRRRDLQRIGDWRLISSLFPVEALFRRRLKDRLALLALAILIFASAGPMWGTRMKEVKQRGVDVFIAIDTSRSMLAEDVSPTRLDRAKQSLGLLIEKLSGNRVGIIAFARRAVLQCPLTTDPDAARLFLNSVTDRTVPEQGTGVGSAIRLGLARFPKDLKSGRAIVLLTDGEDFGSEPMEAAKEAKAAGVPIFTIGIGTPKGEVIKDRDDQGNVTSFHKYKGEMVVSRLDDAMLTKIAELTGGTYYRSSSSDREVDEIAEAINGFQKREFATHVFDRMRERFQVPAALALLILILEFFLGEAPGQGLRIVTRLRALRAPKRAVAAALLLLILPVNGGASVRDSLLQGNRLFKKGDFDGALKAFESAQNDEPDSAQIAFNIATTKYAAGKFEDAVKEFDRADAMAKDPATKARIAYNAAHALYASGKTPEALEKFKQTLRLNPSDVDAKYNVEYIKSGKQPPAQKPSPNPSQTPSGNDKKDDQKQKDKKAGEGEDKEKKDEQPKPKPGELSKEDAEQILQMTKEQESENMKARPMRPIGNKKEKITTGGEDW